MSAEMGLPQGSVLSPVLFNVYLEEALKTSRKLEEVRTRGDLLAFADDMLVMSNNQHEIEMVISELAKLQDEWNLRLNKKKSEILTKEMISGAFEWLSRLNRLDHRFTICGDLPNGSFRISPHELHAQKR
jgi:hypothetical protein